MSRWGHTLARIVARHGITMQAAAAAGQINQSVLCRYASGQISRPTPRALAAMTRAICALPDGRQEAAELVCDHLLDEISAAGLVPQTDVLVRVPGQSIPYHDASTDLQRLDALCHDPRNSQLRSVLRALRVLCDATGYQRAEAAPAPDVAPTGGKRARK